MSVVHGGAGRQRRCRYARRDPDRRGRAHGTVLRLRGGSRPPVRDLGSVRLGLDPASRPSGRRRCGQRVLARCRAARRPAARRALLSEHRPRARVGTQEERPWGHEGPCRGGGPADRPRRMVVPHTARSPSGCDLGTAADRNCANCTPPADGEFRGGAGPASSCAADTNPCPCRRESNAGSFEGSPTGLAGPDPAAPPGVGPIADLAGGSANGRECASSRDSGEGTSPHSLEGAAASNHPIGDARISGSRGRSGPDDTDPPRPSRTGWPAGHPFSGSARRGQHPGRPHPDRCPRGPGRGPYAARLGRLDHSGVDGRGGWDGSFRGSLSTAGSVEPGDAQPHPGAYTARPGSAGGGRRCVRPGGESGGLGPVRVQQPRDGPLRPWPARPGDPRLHRGQPVEPRRSGDPVQPGRGLCPARR